MATESSRSWSTRFRNPNQKMDVMKKIISILSGLAVLLAGCQKELSPATGAEDGRVLVSLSLTGEITVNEEPLVITRGSETSSKDLYGVQVYQNGAAYAYGLFDNISDMSIYLHSGKTYTFECTLIKNGKEIISTVSIDSLEDSGLKFWSDSEKCWYGGGVEYSMNNIYRYFPFEKRNMTTASTIGYLYPFVVCEKNTQDKITRITPASFNLYNANTFHYSSYAGMILLSFGPIILQGGSSYGIPVSCYPEVDRYYGKSGSYVATYGNTTPVTIEMKHVVFGLKYKITGITDGSVSITIKNDDKTFFEQTGITADFTSEQKLYCFTDILSAWQYADGYAENVTVSMTWARGVGVTQDLGSQVVQVKRNAMNTINISLGSDDGGAKLGVNPENAEMGNLSYEFSSHY